MLCASVALGFACAPLRITPGAWVHCRSLCLPAFPSAFSCAPLFVRSVWRLVALLFPGLCPAFFCTLRLAPATVKLSIFTLVSLPFFLLSLAHFFSFALSGAWPYFSPLPSVLHFSARSFGARHCFALDFPSNSSLFSWRFSISRDFFCSSLTFAFWLALNSCLFSRDFFCRSLTSVFRLARSLALNSCLFSRFLFACVIVLSLFCSGLGCLITVLSCVICILI